MEQKCGVWGSLKSRLKNTVGGVSHWCLTPVYHFLTAYAEQGDCRPAVYPRLPLWMPVLICCAPRMPRGSLNLLVVTFPVHHATGNWKQAFVFSLGEDLEVHLTLGQHMKIDRGEIISLKINLIWTETLQYHQHWSVIFQLTGILRISIGERGCKCHFRQLQDYSLQECVCMCVGVGGLVGGLVFVVCNGLLPLAYWFGN